MIEKEKRTRGQRGPDRKPRNHGGGRQRLAEGEKAQTVTIRLYPPEKAAALEKFGSVAAAVRWAIGHYTNKE